MTGVDWCCLLATVRADTIRRKTATKYHRLELARKRETGREKKPRERRHHITFSL
jgi:hypothetical protein